MPGFDRTGPLGEGQRTGWGRGLCGGGRGGYGARPRLGLAHRRGRGRGGGRWGGPWWGGWAEGAEPLERLRDRKRVLEETLRDVVERLDELERKKE